MTFRKADESLVCSHKTGQFLQTCIVTTFKNKHNFWVFYRWINLLSVYSFYIEALQSYVFIYFHQYYLYHYILYLFALYVFFVFWATFRFTNPDYSLTQITLQLTRISERLLSSSFLALLTLSKSHELLRNMGLLYQQSAVSVCQTVRRAPTASVFCVAMPCSSETLLIARLHGTKTQKKTAWISHLEDLKSYSGRIFLYIVRFVHNTYRKYINIRIHIYNSFVVYRGPNTEHR
jgi:hypothetical protein